MASRKALSSKFVIRGVTSFVLCCVSNVLAAPAPTIHVPRIDSPPTLADFEEMHPNERVADMIKVSGFIAREPSDGAKPTQDTDVYLAFDQKNLYAAFVCWDKEPDKIRARMARREDISSDDSAEIMIDTFHDARAATPSLPILSACSGTPYGPRAAPSKASLPTTAASICHSILSGTPRDNSRRVAISY